MTRDLLERHRALRLLLGLVIVVLAIVAANLIWGMLVFFGDVILLFFLAWIIAFALEPVSIFLQRRNVPRTLAVTLIYLALLVVVSGGIVLAIPSIVEEIKLLGNEVMNAVAATTTLNSTLVGALRRVGFTPKAAQDFANSLSQQLNGWALNATGDAVNAATDFLTSMLTVVFDAFLVLILSFYMMLDGDRLVESLVVRLPPNWIPEVRLFQRYVERIFGGFFRAQMTVGTIYGVLTWVVLALLGQANGLLVALLAGAIMLLPFIGPFLAIIPPVLLVLLQSPPNDLLRNLIVIVVMSVVAQQVVFQLIAPRVFGSQMGVHPLLLFGGLLVGAKVGGVWGAFFAGPIVAVVYAMLRVYYDRFSQTSPLFQETPAGITSTTPAAAAQGTPAPFAEARDETPPREPVSGGAAHSGRPVRPGPRSN